MGNCCCTPPPDAPPLGACCFREDRDNLVTVNPNASRQNQINPYDANGDGIVNESDAGFVNDYLKGLVTGGFPDVNGDGAVAPIDTLLILNHLNFRDNPVSFFGDTKCVNNVTETECLLGYTHAAREETIDGTNYLVKRGYASFKPEQTCGSTETCPNTSDTYNSICGDTHCPRYICNVETGECTASIPEGADITKWPYTLVDNCTECQKTQPGCCCRYWTDPEGILPDYNITEYVQDISSCRGVTSVPHLNQIIEVTNTFTPNYSTDAAGQVFCEGHAPCNEKAGWYCVTDLSDGDKYCKYYNSDPQSIGNLIFSNPYTSEADCNSNCTPDSTVEQGDLAISILQSKNEWRNKGKENIFLNDCLLPQTFIVTVSRFSYDLSGRADSISFNIIDSHNNTTSTHSFPAPDVVNREFSQEIDIPITLPVNFIGDITVTISNPTGGARIKRGEVSAKFIEYKCTVCCKNGQVILRDVTPCDCVTAGGKCNIESCWPVNAVVPGRCCISASCPDDDPCPEVFKCIDNVLPYKCNEENYPFIIAGKQFSATYSPLGHATCSEEPKCYTTTTTTEAPFPCSCSEVGKENVAGGENGCLYTYNKSSDSFNLISDCPEGGDCPYDPNCFRTPTLQDQDLIAVPCCGTPEPPPPCDYCCVDPHEVGATNLTPEECEALNGHCINEKDFPEGFTSELPFVEVAKNYCSELNCPEDNITPAFKVVYEGSGVHNPKTDVFTYNGGVGSFVTYNFHEGLLHINGFSATAGNGNNSPFKFIIDNGPGRILETPYYGSSSYQEELDSAIGGSNLIQSWDGYLSSGFILIDEVVEVTVHSPLENNGWSYNLSCGKDCRASGLGSAYYNKYLGNSDLMPPNYSFDQILGFNPNRLNDKGLIIETSGGAGGWIKNSTLSLGETGVGSDPCHTGVLYMSYSGVTDIIDGVYNVARWTLGDPEGIRVVTRRENNCNNPSTTYPDQYSPVFSSNEFDFEPQGTIGDYCTSSCKQADYRYYQASLEYEVRINAFGECEARWVAPTGLYSDSCDLSESTMISWKIGCIDAVVTGVTLPLTEEQKPLPFRWSTENAEQHESDVLVLRLPDEITDIRIKNCKCFNSMCCDGSTGDCTSNLTWEECECERGTGYQNATNEETEASPCNVYYHGPTIIWEPCGNDCEGTLDPSPDAYYSCDQIYNLCNGF